jgi:Cu(I)/Ag(I) efflux system membrane fusion protein
MGELYPVIAGLSEGERVVIHGAFTLDADLQIRGGNSMMTAPDDMQDGPYDKIIKVSDEYKNLFGSVVRHYLALHEALAGDKLDAALAASSELSKAAATIQPKSPAELHDAWMPLRRQLLAHTAHLAKSKTLAEARIPFRELSQQLATLLRVFGNPTKETVRLASCPMALAGEGAEWVQRASEIENPYFGASMHDCGDIHQVVEHGTYLPVNLGDDGARPAPAAPQGHQH